MNFAVVPILLGLVLIMMRALRGPSLYDRLLAANTLGTVVVLLIVWCGSWEGRLGLFLDIALVYALMNFIGTIAVLKFFEYGDMSRSGRT